CTRHGMAVDAGSRLEYALALRNSVIYNRRLVLQPNPPVKFVSRLDVNTQQHFGMLGSAILRALAEINSGLLRIDPHAVRMVGNQIRLTAQPRHPKTVVSVGG